MRRTMFPVKANRAAMGAARRRAAPTPWRDPVPTAHLRPRSRSTIVRATPQKNRNAAASDTHRRGRPDVHRLVAAVSTRTTAINPTDPIRIHFRPSAHTRCLTNPRYRTAKISVIRNTSPHPAHNIATVAHAFRCQARRARRAGQGSQEPGGRSIGNHLNIIGLPSGTRNTAIKRLNTS